MEMAQAGQSVEKRSFGSRLRRTDIDRGTPWRELIGIGLKGMRESVIARAAIDTVGELADALDDGRLVEVDGVGPKTRAVIADEFARLLDQGRERYLYGKRGRPSTIRDLVEQALEMLTDRCAAIVRRRFLEGETLAEIGRQLALSRERIRQLRERALDELSPRFGDVARELVAGVVQELDASAGLLCRSHLVEWFGDDPPPVSQVVLASRLAGFEQVRRWDEMFVTTHRAGVRAALLEQLAEFLRSRQAPEVSVAAVHTWADRRGVALDDRAAVWLAKRAVDLDLSDGPRRAPWWTSREALLGAMERIETPADVPRVRRAYEAVRQRYPSLPELNDKNLRSRLQQSDQVYNYDHGVYVHAGNLPVAPEELEEGADRVVERLEGEPDAVSIETLLAEIRRAGMLCDEVTPHMLKSVLTERPGVETFKNTLLVADAESFENDDVTMVDRIEPVLRRADAPMSVAEITEALSEYSYAKSSVQCGLAEADFALRWEHGRYFHRDRLDLGDREVDALLAACLQSLPDDGAPRTTDRLCARLEPASRRLLDGFPSPPHVVWALAEDDDRFETDYARLLARSGEGDRLLLKPRLLRAIEAIGPADFRALCEHLRRHLGLADADGTIRNALQSLRRAGHIECDGRRYDTLGEG